MVVDPCPRQKQAPCPHQPAPPTTYLLLHLLLLFRKTGIVHGDCHINNILKGTNGFLEAFDFERCFVPIVEDNPNTGIVIDSFVKAASDAELKSLLPKFKQLGLDRTRSYFSKLAHECLGSAEKLFTLDKDALAGTFWGQPK